MAPQIDVRPSPPARRRSRTRWWWAAAAVGLALSSVVLAHAFDDPAMVGHVRLVNQTDYAVHVDVTDPARRGWMAVGTALPRVTTVVEDVVDQGDVWVVRLSSEGVVAAELRVRRSDLARSRWTITVPREAAARLARAGVQPPPTS
jgi:hypothetical protein